MDPRMHTRTPAPSPYNGHHPGMVPQLGGSRVGQVLSDDQSGSEADFEMVQPGDMHGGPYQNPMGQVPTPFPHPNELQMDMNSVPFPRSGI